MKQVQVSVGDQVFIGTSQEEVGAVRLVEPDHLFVYIENAGEFRVERVSVMTVHDGKIVLDPATVDPKLLAAAGHAHERETD